MVKKQEQLIHLKFGYSQAKEARKDFLSSQADLLKIYQIIDQYKKLRIEELEKKEKLASQIRVTKLELAKMKKILPKVVLPKILKKEIRIEEEIKSKNEIQEVTKYGTVEDQLREIQRKLQELE